MTVPLRHPSPNADKGPSVAHAPFILPTLFEDLTAVCALAKRPNVAVKASGMPSLSTQEYPFRDLHDAIRRLVDAFGPRRTFWGTDLLAMTGSPSIGE